MALGFKSSIAFYNICLELDYRLSPIEIDMFWTCDLYGKEVYRRIANILEQLKHE